MDDKEKLLGELHALRLKLQQIAQVRGKLTDPDVLAASEAADELVVTLQRIQKEELLKLRTGQGCSPNQ